MTTTNPTCRMAITDRASSDGSPSKKRSRISSADGTSMDDESIENRWTRRRSVLPFQCLTMTDFSEDDPGEERWQKRGREGYD